MQAAPGIPGETVVCDADASRLTSGRWTCFETRCAGCVPVFYAQNDSRVSTAVFATLFT